jgi:acylphosphatase
MNVCRHCKVSGRVQGVFYRASTQQQAQMLGVTGKAVNCPDGSVEVIACGEEKAVKALCDWLWDGPRQAEVMQVDCEEIEFKDYSGFITR